MHLVTRTAGVLSAVRLTTGGFQRKHFAGGVPVMRAGLAREQRVRGPAAAGARFVREAKRPGRVPSNQAQRRAREGVPRRNPRKVSPGASGVLVAGSRQACTKAAGERRQALG